MSFQRSMTTTPPLSQLTPVEQKFVLHWGEMGTRWGINRTEAQIHALLMLSPKPLNAEQIQETLGVARSNVSNSLRELQNWGVIKLVHLPGDRRDHFESLKDVWEMFRIVLHERKKREMDPTLALLRDCVQEAGRSDVPGGYTEQRLRELQNFFETISGWYDQAHALPPEAVGKVARMGDKALKLLGLKS